MSMEYCFIHKDDYRDQIGLLKLYIGKLEAFRQDILHTVQVNADGGEIVTRAEDIKNTIDFDLVALRNRLEHTFAPKRQVIGTKTAKLFILSTDFQTLEELDQFHQANVDRLIVVDEYGEPVNWALFRKEIESLSVTSDS